MFPHYVYTKHFLERRFRRYKVTPDNEPVTDEVSESRGADTIAVAARSVPPSQSPRNTSRPSDCYRGRHGSEDHRRSRRDSDDGQRPSRFRSPDKQHRIYPDRRRKPNLEKRPVAGIGADATKKRRRNEVRHDGSEVLAESAASRRRSSSQAKLPLVDGPLETGTSTGTLEPSQTGSTATFKGP